MGDATTTVQADDSPITGKKSITKLAQQEVGKKLRLGSIEDLPSRLLGLNQSSGHNGELVVNSKHFVDDPEILHSSYPNDEAKQDVLNLDLQSYCRKPRRVALTDREKLFSNANQPLANTKDPRFQLDILELKQSIEQPKTAQEVRHAYPSFNIVDAPTKSTKASIMLLQLVQIGWYNLPSRTIIENSAGLSAKTWPESMRTEQQKRGSQDERIKIDSGALFTPVRAKSLESDLPRAMSIPPKNRFLFEYKDLMTIFKDDDERARNNGEALEDPNLDEYHNMKGREEDDTHKSKTSQHRTHSRTNHVVNPTLSDRQGQVAATQNGMSSTPVMGKGS